MARLAESSESESYCSTTDSTLEGVSSNSSEVESGSVRTILNSLKPPAPSQLAQKRKLTIIRPLKKDEHCCKS